MIRLSKLSLIERSELFKALRIAITHHSNAIEGTRLNYGETKLLLEEGISAPNKRLDEQLVILGFAQAYDVIIREASNKNTLLGTSFVKDLHYLIFSKALEITPDFVQKPLGSYRNTEVSIKGVEFETCAVSKISQNLENLLFKFQSNKMDLEQIAQFHADYEQIHPFTDGNGRTGRLLMSFQCIQNDIIPPLITNECRNEYIQSLYIAQTTKNIEPFKHFLETSQETSLNLINQVPYYQKQIPHNAQTTKNKKR